MNIHEIKNLPIDELRTLLEGENIGMEEQSYMRPLSPAELAEKKAQFTQLAIEKAEIDDEFKEIKDGFKSRLKPLHNQISTTLAIIKQRGEWTKGQCYKIPDYDNRIVHIVDAAGIVIDSRMMRPDERQLTISHSQAM